MHYSKYKFLSEILSLDYSISSRCKPLMTRQAEIDILTAAISRLEELKAALVAAPDITDASLVNPPAKLSFSGMMWRETTNPSDIMGLLSKKDAVNKTYSTDTITVYGLVPAYIYNKSTNKIYKRVEIPFHTTNKKGD